MKQGVLSLVYLVLLLAGLYLFYLHFLPYLLPFIAATALTLFIEPVVARLSTLVPRGWAVALVLAFGLAVFATGLYYGISRLVIEAIELQKEIPRLNALASDLLLSFSGQLEVVVDRIPFLPSIEEFLLRGQSTTWGNLDQILKLTLGTIQTLPGAVGNALVGFGITILATFFLSRDRKIIHGFLVRLIPEEIRQRFLYAESQVFLATLRYAKAQLVLVLVTGTLSTLGLAIIGADYAFILGLTAGLLDLVPYLGPTGVFIPWIIYTLVVGNYLLAFKLGVLFTIVSLVRQVVEPRVVGDFVGIHPLVILFSIYVGVRVLGPWGIFLGPLTAIIIKAFAMSSFFPVYAGADGNRWTEE